MSDAKSHIVLKEMTVGRVILHGGRDGDEDELHQLQNVSRTHCQQQQQPPSIIYCTTATMAVSVLELAKPDHPLPNYNY